ncbi:MAG: hypothetical protein IJW16_04395 [Clostridia bacterium]|nr:hypothetical protein [Clostridia bacterium]
MKRIFWNLTLVSLITLIAYIVLYVIWGAILNEVENTTLRLSLIALMTTVAFGAILLYISKIKKSVGEDEVLADYRNKLWRSWFDDLKLIIRRESRMLTCIVGVVLICFALNTFDRMIFDRKTISVLTFFFAPMYLFDTVINIPFVGYALSAVLNCAVYLMFLLLYRKKKYNYWMKNNV